MAAAATVVTVAPNLPLAYAGLAGIGFAWSLLLSSVIGTLQTADTSMMGRIMSLFALVLLGGNAAGSPMAAFSAVLAGPRAPFVVAAVAAVAAALTSTTLSTMDTQRAPVAQAVE